MDQTRTEDEIRDQISEAVESGATGSKWPGMSYEDGVRASLEWVLGDDDTPPMQDEE